MPTPGLAAAGRRGSSRSTTTSRARRRATLRTPARGARRRRPQGRSPWRALWLSETVGRRPGPAATPGVARCRARCGRPPAAGSRDAAATTSSTSSDDPAGVTRRRSGRRRARRGGSVRRTAVASPVASPDARGLDREHLLEVGDQLVRRRGSAREVLGRRAVDDRGQRAGDLGPRELDVGQLLADVLHRDGDLVLALERDVAGEHLVEDDAERVEVALPGDGVAERLLGRDVVGRAEHAPVGGQAVLVERARDAEVGDLGRALLVDQDVLRLDVAVDDAAARARRRAPARSRSRRRRPRGSAAGRCAGCGPSASRPRRTRRRCTASGAGVASSPASITPTMCGWLSCATARASRRKRSSWSESWAMLAVHQLDRDLALEHRVEGAVDRRHAARADLGARGGSGR